MDSSSLPSTSQVTDNGAPFHAESLRPAINTILKGADRDKVSAKAVRKELQTLYPDINVRAHKEAIDALVMEIFNAGQEDDEEEEPSSEDKPLIKSNDSDDDRKPSTSSYKIPKKEKKLSDAELAKQLAYQLNGPAKTTRGGNAGKPKASWGRQEKKQKKSRATVDSDDDSGAESGEPQKKKKKKASGGGYNKPLRLSPALSALCGGEEILSRPQVVSKVWEHIKANDLQNPKDRREILCDGVMKAVMPAKVTMFSMNKFFSNHLSPVDDDADVKPKSKSKSKAKKEETDSDSE